MHIFILKTNHCVNDRTTPTPTDVSYPATFPIPTLDFMPVTSPAVFPDNPEILSKPHNQGYQAQHQSF